MDPGSLQSRLLTEGVVVTALVTAALVMLMAVAHLSDVMGAGGRRTAMVVLLLGLTAAIAATTALLFPDLAQRVFNYLDQLGYR